jgi:hypothetical protein
LKLHAALAYQSFKGRLWHRRCNVGERFRSREDKIAKRQRDQELAVLGASICPSPSLSCG